uniref:TSA: Wollemia nobilis Ref_Wollemi_Transcript_19770_1289 transcribed RNA sequence n=1 Tax=Wollemia nobilis TaxID=56998 RepID=A0A0C9S2E0_9CONI
MVYSESSEVMSMVKPLPSISMKNYQWWTSDLQGILCMEGGEGDGSYALNSEAAASAIALSKPFLRKAINCMDLFFTESSLRIADLGCATGNNTLSTVDFVVESLKSRYGSTSPPPEFEAFFSDLPSTDFNTLFRSLAPRLSSRKNERKRSYYAAGVPGSFYERLFPKGKLHVAISLSALHWMSRIPDAVLNKNSRAWNRGRAWIDGASIEVVEAYAKQSDEDLKAFLRCRAEEIVSGGLLFLLMAGRPDSEPLQNQLGDPVSRAKHPFTDCMDQAWNDLVNEGLIHEDTRDGFNIPAYMRSSKEIQQAFDHCNAFEIKCIEFRKVMEHSKTKQKQSLMDPVSYAKAKTNLVRATMGPMIVAHLGSSDLSDEFFKRFEKRAAPSLTMLNKICHYGVIVVFAKRI